MPTEFEQQIEPIKNYLNQKETACAIYNNKYELIWAKSDSFFNSHYKLTHEANAGSFSNIKEKIIPVNVNGEKTPITVTPYYINKKLCFFICTALKKAELIDQIKSSQMQDDVKNILNTQYSLLAHIIDAANTFENELRSKTTDESRSLLERQISSISQMMAQNGSLDLLWDNGRTQEEKQCYVNKLLLEIKDECQKELNIIGRKIIYKSEGGNSVIGVYPKDFTTIIMNLLQNALLYSPLSGDIELSLTFPENIAVIKIKNEIYKPERDKYSIEHTSIGLQIVKKAIFDAGGNFKYTETRDPENGNNYAVAEIQLPLLKLNEISAVESDKKDFIQERFKTLHTFLYEPIHKNKENL